MKTFSKIFIFMFFSVSAFAHLGGIAGKVIDSKTKQAIFGANFVLTGLNRGVISDEFGNFSFNNLSTSPYKIEVSFIGYKAQIQTIIVKEDKISTIEIQLIGFEIMLEEVKISASDPNHQKVISSLDIKLRSINNSQEILRIIPGLFIGQHQGGGKAEQIFLRGFDLDHGTDIRLSVDGLPINMVSHAHGQGYADAHFIIPELVEGVDFKKGLYDADKGNFATAGWVNFRTKSVLDQNFVKSEIGQFNTFRVMAALNLLGEAAKTNNQSAYVAGEYNYSDSYFDAPQNFKRINILGKYHGHISEKTFLTLTASTFWSKWNASGQIPDRAVDSGEIGFYGAIDPNEGGQTSRTNLNAEFLTLTKKNNIWKNQFFYSNYNFELYSNFTFYLNDPENGDQIRQKESRNLWGYNGSFSKNYLLGNKEATTTLGVNYRHDLTNNTELSHTLDRTVTLKKLNFGDINEANLGVYFDENIQLSSKFSAILGLRFDYFNNQYTDHLANNLVKNVNSATISPKFNLFFTQNQHLQFYLTTGKGFHSNDTRAVVSQKGLETLPTAYGADLGTVWKPFPRMVVNAAFWYLWLAQEFVYSGDAGVVEPSGKSVRQGIDVSLRYQITNRLFFDTDANLAKPRAIGGTEGQNYLPLAPIFTTTGGFSMQNKNGFNGSLRYRYIADRPANENNSLVAKGYFITDAQLSFSKPKYNVGLTIQNLLNSRWKETQFATKTRLKNEATPVTEIHFTPGTPFFAKLGITYFF